MEILKLSGLEITESGILIKSVGLYDADRKFIRNAKLNYHLLQELEKRILIDRDGMRRFGATYYDASKVGELEYYQNGGEYIPEIRE